MYTSVFARLRIRLVCALCFVALAATFTSYPAEAQRAAYYVASFNIQNLGQTKMSRAPIRRYLAEVIREFDIVAVQEVSDIQERAPRTLLEEINRNGARYELLLSPRSGQQTADRSAQEQYAFYYNSARIELVDEGALYDDSQGNQFRREPYTAQFRIKNTGLTFTVTQIHTTPDRAVEEIDSLIHVYRGLSARFGGETNHVIVGDFNASCSYATPTQLREMQIRRSRELIWVVGDDEDTTVSENTHCAYDRIITTRSMLPNHHQWGIANWFEDKAVSDHWPVWISFR